MNFRQRIATWREAITDWLAPDSFGVVGAEGHHFFVEAHDFGVDLEGRLIFWQRRWLVGRRIVSVVEAGVWRRVLRGLAWDEISPGV